MFRGFEVALVFVIIVAIGYVSVTPELDEADELIQGSPELDDADELVHTDQNVTCIKLTLSIVTSFPQSILFTSQ